jgi:hypothetical protein
VIIDNPKCAIVRACYTDPDVQRAYAEYAEGYGFRILACPPRDPRKKGIVEAGVKYVKRSFMPLRQFRDMVDANRQLYEWVMTVAGNRSHGTTREQPLKRFTDTERALLKRLPDPPPELAVWAQVKVHRDAHVQFEKILYSVPFRLMGQPLWLKATFTTISLYQEHRLVATHPRGSNAGQRFTVQDHLPPDAQAWSLADPQHCLTRAESIGPACRQVVEQLFAHRVLDNLRAAQGVIRLAKQYGNARLEAACQRALSFGDARYRTIKTILARSLDQSPTSGIDADPVDDCYRRGGRFYRDPSTSLH